MCKNAFTLKIFAIAKKKKEKTEMSHNKALVKQTLISLYNELLNSH